MSGHRLTFRFRGETTPVLVDSDSHVHVRDEFFDVAPAIEDAWRITEQSGSTRVVHVVSSEEGVWTHIDGNVFLIESGHADRSAGHQADPLGGLTAPMPATVLSVVAPVGTQVAAGEVVLILEAMKMELPIRAPQAGTVTAVHCSEGQLVQPGLALVEIA
jgi:acetyl/propionyl-CoA carboxylase alpha subunit